MAGIRLDRDEVNDLPRVCMRCGADAVTTREKRFSWHPQWVSTLVVVGLLCFTPLILAGLILMLVLTKRMRVRVPFCEVHQNYFRDRSVLISGGLVLFLVLGVGSFALLIALEKPGGNPFDQFTGFLCLGLGVTGLVWLITAAIVQSMMIRATEITDDSITLTKVAPEFVDALKHDRIGDRWDDAETGRRRPLRQGGDQIFDPNLPADKPRREAPPDAYRADEPSSNA
jgi:hypothetical protein